MKLTPFLTGQIHALVEDIRLLEAFVTAPLGLYSDLKMLREALPFPEAAELERAEQQQRRLAYRGMSDDPPATALAALAHVHASLAAVKAVKALGEPILDDGWISQAELVLARAELQVAGGLRSGAAAGIAGLYVIVDPEAVNGRPVVEVTRAALRGGANVIQLRDKHGSKGSVLRTAREMKALCDDHDALFIVNDHADLAFLSGAHGLHVGQADLGMDEARSVLGHAQLVGRSNNTVEEAVSSEAEGADYVAVGAVYPTSTMGKADRNVVGLETVERVKTMVEAPVVAIGGIDRRNAAAVLAAGADCVCVASAVAMAADPEAAAREMVQAIASAAG